MTRFSFTRLGAMVFKEFVQIKRDRLTFAILIVVPIMQLLLFGYAINSNPKYLPTVVIANDHSNFTRQFIAGLQNTDYFKIVNTNTNEKTANRLLAEGAISFIVNVPTNFTRDLIRGDKPQLLVTADATDPVATSNAVAALSGLSEQVFNLNFQRGLSNLQRPPPSFAINIHQKYNPEGNTQYNIVSGLMGVVLTMTMVMTTSVAITRERERGTMENLLAMPILPLEVMIGKILPFIIMGYIQQFIIIALSTGLFHVPFNGSLTLLLVCTLFFVAANLSVGILFSTAAKNQLQAVQMTFFFFLPSLLLSGFMFPFFGMPEWARYLGNLLPLTHFLYIARGIMLKGNDFIAIWPHIWPLWVFTLAVILLGLKRYRRTLD
jgi:ABC-2 type transport system permease protein